MHDLTSDLNKSWNQQLCKKFSCWNILERFKFTFVLNDHVNLILVCLNSKGFL